MKRLFVAATLTDKARETIHARRPEEIEGVRFVPPEQLHMTLRFVGDADEGKQAELVSALGAIQASKPDIDVMEPCFLGKPRHPSVFALAVEPTGKLTALHEKVEQIAVDLGFEPEGREFNPHITVARLKRKFRYSRDYKQLLATYERLCGLQFKSTSYVLYSSELSQDGATHHVEKVFRFGRKR